MSDALTGARRVLVPGALWLSFAANDGEELLTMAANTNGTASWLLARLRRHPGAQLSQTRVNVGVGVMALLVGAAAADGVRTAGRGWLYQDVQRVFGLHGYGHIAASVLTRGYTSGVVTSPTVVLPLWWWGRRELRRAGVPDVSRLGRGAVVMGAWLALAHTLGELASKRVEGRR